MSATVISHYLQLLLKLYLPSGRSTSQTGVRRCKEMSRKTAKLSWSAIICHWAFTILFGTSRSMGKFRNTFVVKKNQLWPPPPKLMLHLASPVQTHTFYLNWTNHQACWCPEAGCSQHTMFTSVLNQTFWLCCKFLLESTLKQSFRQGHGH